MRESAVQLPVFRRELSGATWSQAVAVSIAAGHERPVRYGATVTSAHRGIGQAPYRGVVASVAEPTSYRLRSKRDDLGRGRVQPSFEGMRRPTEGPSVSTSGAPASMTCDAVRGGFGWTGAEGTRELSEEPGQLSWNDVRGGSRARKLA